MAYEDLDFLDLYLTAIDHTQCPRVYHIWAACALVAACLNDHTWYEKFPGDKLYPNLYTTLVGQSASGKNAAINFASKLVKNRPDDLFRYRGKITGAGLADVLLRPQARKGSDANRPTVWLVLPELANGVGQGKLADDFIKRLTDLSSGEDDTYQESTRALIQEGNEIKYSVPVINTLFGSTVQWLVECVTLESIHSGFFGRMLVVDGHYDRTRRICDPTFPEDYPQMVEELEVRVGEMLRLTGPFTLEEKAKRIRRAWYDGRPDADNDLLQPSWGRQDDNILKVAMILSAMSGRYDMVITAQEWVDAEGMIDQCYHDLQNLMKWAARTASVSAGELERVADAIRVAGRIPHSPLLKKVAHYGLHGRDLAAHLKSLEERGEIITHRTEHGARVYEWKGDR